jgi:hypothetical protein
VKATNEELEKVLKEIGTLVQDSIRPVKVITVRAAAERVGRRPDDMKTTIARAKKQHFDVLRCCDTGAPVAVILNERWVAYETKMKARKA